MLIENKYGFCGLEILEEGELWKEVHCGHGAGQFYFFKPSAQQSIEGVCFQQWPRHCNQSLDWDPTCTLKLFFFNIVNTEHKKKKSVEELGNYVCVLPGMVPRTEVFTSLYLLSLRHLWLLQHGEQPGRWKFACLLGGKGRDGLLEECQSIACFHCWWGKHLALGKNILERLGKCPYHNNHIFAISTVTLKNEP